MMRRFLFLMAAIWLTWGCAVLAQPLTNPAKQPLRPQEPRPPFPYRTDSVLFYNADSSVRFGATLTLPAKEKVLAAVVMVSGTGKQDRDGTMAGHKMFAVIADYLTRRGIAVLRTDDRGAGQTTGSYEKATTGDFAADALSALNYLKSCPALKKVKIGMIGHSEGGAAMSVAASQSKDIAFIVSLAGLAMNGYDALVKQNLDLVANSPLPERDKRRANEINDIMFNTVRTYVDSPGLEARLNKKYTEWKKKDDEFMKTQNVQFDHFRFPVYMYTQTATSPWYRWFIKYDAAKVMSQIKVPVLALNGDRDLMVACNENLANWKKYPALGGNTKVATIILPGLNHLFQHCQKCDIKEYAELDESFSPDALQLIESWIKKTVN